MTVEDTGTGLTPEALQRMFERFWRDDEARQRRTGGAGLGLAIARGLVERTTAAGYGPRTASAGEPESVLRSLSRTPDPRLGMPNAAHMSRGTTK